MKKTLLVAPLLAIALVACGKKEEPVMTPPAISNPAPQAAPATPAEADKPADANSLSQPGLKNISPTTGQDAPAK